MTYERVQRDKRRLGASSSVPHEIQQLLKDKLKLKSLVKQITLPLSPPTNHHTMLLTHVFDISTTTIAAAATATIRTRTRTRTIMPVKYTAYKVLGTSLFLLTEDGKVTVMDIETGQVTGSIANVAANTALRMAPFAPFSGLVHGIDVNVVSGHEVVVTSREGLLRSILC